MNIVIVCSNCQEKLLEQDVRERLGNEIIASVSPCDCNKQEDKVDCSRCEDLSHLNKKIIELQRKLETANEKLQKIKDFFMSEKPDEGSDKEATNLPTEPEPTKPELDTNIKNLQPTSDVASTGGAIIPGIKKDSAEGVKGNY